jgi:hypothetical protein
MPTDQQSRLHVHVTSRHPASGHQSTPAGPLRSPSWWRMWMVSPSSTEAALPMYSVAAARAVSASSESKISRYRLHGDVLHGCSRALTHAGGRVGEDRGAWGILRSPLRSLPAVVHALSDADRHSLDGDHGQTVRRRGASPMMAASPSQPASDGDVARSLMACPPRPDPNKAAGLLKRVRTILGY